MSNKGELMMKQLKDGKYLTQADSIHGYVKVSTEIKDNKISDVDVLFGSGEFQSMVNTIIPKKIIEEQSTRVDAVTGATSSSNAIMDAVDEALAQASVE